MCPLHWCSVEEEILCTGGQLEKYPLTSVLNKLHSYQWLGHEATWSKRKSLQSKEKTPLGQLSPKQVSTMEESTLESGDMRVNFLSRSKDRNTCDGFQHFLTLFIAKKKKEWKIYCMSKAQNMLQSVQYPFEWPISTASYCIQAVVAPGATWKQWWCWTVTSFNAMLSLFNR